MIDLMTEMLVYLVVAALIGVALGYLIWGWSTQSRIAAARAEGATGARTTVAGDDVLQSKLDACTAERARLEEELEALRERLPVEKGPEDTIVDAPETPPTRVAETSQGSLHTDEAPEPDAAADDAVPDTPEALPTAVEPGPPPTSLLSERPDEVDDLKEIKGVGKVMEGVLNDKGIYLFRQVANFTPSDVAWVNEAIEAFPGRIERDDWVGQAQALYLGKYGRSHHAED